MATFTSMFTFVPVKIFLDKSNCKNITYRVCYIPKKRYMFITYVCSPFEDEPETKKNNKNDILTKLLVHQAVEWEASDKSFKHYNDSYGEKLTFTQWCFWKRQVITLKKMMGEDYSFLVSCKILYRHTFLCKTIDLNNVTFINEVISNIVRVFPAYDKCISVHKTAEKSYDMCLSLYMGSLIGRYSLKLLENLVNDIELSFDIDDYEVTSKQ